MAEKVDDWFTRFGYKTNRIKLPNQTGRENFNFVQIGNTENMAIHKAAPDPAAREA